MYILNILTILRNSFFPIIAITIVSTVLATDFSKPPSFNEYEVLSENDFQKYIEEQLHWGSEANLFCLNNGEAFDGIWTPTSQQIKTLELIKEELYKLRADFKPISYEIRNSKYYIDYLARNPKVMKIRGRLSDYYREYKGIVINGEKVICISAAAKWARWDYKDEIYKDRNYFPNRIPVLEETIWSDSQEALWGAIYNPTNRSFSSLKTYR